jgi:hypothetical protein
MKCLTRAGMNEVLDDSNFRKGRYLEYMRCVSFDMYSQNALFGKRGRTPLTGGEKSGRVEKTSINL